MDDHEENELAEEGDEHAPVEKRDEPGLFMGVDDEDLLGGDSDDEKSEDDELGIAGMHVEEDESGEGDF